MADDVTIILHDYEHLSFTGDTMSGPPNATGTPITDILVGDGDSDILVGGKGDDILEGGAGNDLLIGGELNLHDDKGPSVHDGEYTTSAAGADTFVFNFTLQHDVGATYYFRPNEAGTGGDTPNSSANIQAWQNYIEQLAEWRASMEAQFGTDQDTDKDVNATYTVKKTTGSLGQFDNSFTTGGDGWTIASHDGTDTIVKFGDHDTLQLKGLGALTSEAEFDTLFDVGLNAHGDTVLSWEGGSITVDGLALSTVHDFWAAGQADGWFVI